MNWFLYDIGLRHERVKLSIYVFLHFSFCRLIRYGVHVFLSITRQGQALRDHSFSTCAKFPEKVTYLTS